MSLTAFAPDRVDQIVETLAAMLQRRSIARELETLKRFAIFPEQIDEILLAAINTSLNLEDETLAAEIPPLRIDEEPGHPKADRAA
jgi:predicted component of type VI protein secretion system